MSSRWTDRLPRLSQARERLGAGVLTLAWQALLGEEAGADGGDPRRFPLAPDPDEPTYWRRRDRPRQDREGYKKEY